MNRADRSIADSLLHAPGRVLLVVGAIYALIAIAWLGGIGALMYYAIKWLAHHP